jgi:hypothetical protein
VKASPIRRVRGLALLVAVFATVVPSGGVRAEAAPDASPPVWTKIPTATIPLGASLDPWTCQEAGDELRLGPVYVDYEARDPQSGIDHYEVDLTDWSEEGDVGLLTRDTAGSTTVDPADCFGGGRKPRYYQAFNGAGLGSDLYRWSPVGLHATQDTPSATVAYAGAWATSTCACWSGGTTRKTSQAGASVRLLVRVSEGSGPIAFGLVMAKGPGRGRASVFVDAVKVATVDTGAASPLNRTVVWRRQMTPGEHTVRVVNLATTGRARIDFDAFVAIVKRSQLIPQS